MLEVLALAREDGWAFVRDGARIVALRPPYDRATPREVSDAVVARAVGDHGFTPSGEKFVDWPAVIEYLRHQMIKAREEEGRKLPPEGVGRALLRHAPADEVSEMLEQVEAELLPAKELSAAERMLMAVLEVSPHVRRDDTLYRRALKLLGRVREEVTANVLLLGGERLSVARAASPKRRTRAAAGFPTFHVELPQ
jgi:hypothetical protein